MKVVKSRLVLAEDSAAEEPRPEDLARREALALVGKLACGACVMALGAGSSGCEVSELRDTGGGGGGGGGGGDGGTNPNEWAFDLSQAQFAPLLSPPALVPINTNGKKIMLVAVSSGEIVCMSRACTHQGCDLSPDLSGLFDANAGMITCRCHGATFDLHGVVTNPPATMALKSWPVAYDATARKGKVTFA